MPQNIIVNLVNFVSSGLNNLVSIVAVDVHHS